MRQEGGGEDREAETSERGAVRDREGGRDRRGRDIEGAGGWETGG